MIPLKKKTVLQELALSLYLMLEFNPDTTTLSLINRIRERAKAAIDAAAVFTGEIGEKDVHKFLTTKPLSFTHKCNEEFVIGDIIRFIEEVFDNRRNPPRHLGKRGITAEVREIHEISGTPILHMRVIESGGTWDLKPDTIIRRTVGNILRAEAVRAAWDDEKERREKKHEAREQRQYTGIAIKQPRRPFLAEAAE